MAEASVPSDGEKLCPKVASYGPTCVEDLTPGETKYWCACGLSKKQPWCDGSHKGTGMKPLKWTVPDQKQRLFYLCNCKHTKSPPLCDGSHTLLPEEVKVRQEKCTEHGGEKKVEKLCTGCGWVPDF